MKAYQFLRKFLQGSSTIDHIYLRCGSIRVKLNEGDIRDPANKSNSHYEELTSSVESFRITGNEMEIWCKQLRP